MIDSAARIPTDQPQRYIKQLVSHLGHKRTTELLPDGNGLISFERGECRLGSEPGTLVLTATAEDDEALRHVQDVVGRHLERFGGREGLRVQWS